IVFLLGAAAPTMWQRLEMNVAEKSILAGDAKNLVVLTVGGTSEQIPPIAKVLDVANMQVDDIVNALLPAERSESANTVDDELLRMADAYLQINLPDWSARTKAKQKAASRMGAYVLKHRVSRDLLARSSHEGLIVALAAASAQAPDSGDLARLINAGQRVDRLHVAYQILVAIVAAADRERVTAPERIGIEELLAKYELAAKKRSDAPLANLVQVTRRRFLNVT